MKYLEKEYPLGLIVNFGENSSITKRIILICESVAFKEI